MSYAPSRSLAAELDEGLTDQTYKKINRDRGGVVEPTTYGVRQDWNDLYYGLHETPVKRRPDGVAARTPGYVPNAPAHLYFGM
ncbi:hypothetical protein DMB38_20025 [Streptomyces sp. WAC 06738]|uniref:hypothetical protein n=1 Tax=Streptomyces sp. WAC 06738 TaxID=2203210 RepID=UPI000F6F9749|nr:hypothetical protein [Streptomyces sp. WAC 06738]AZM47766.1 hypothetical protein DMB38_20025 [Streptomyces sp. WAC 06738]